MNEETKIANAMMGLADGLQAIFDMLLAEIAQVRYQRQIPQHLLVFSLNGTILEYMRGCIALIRNHNTRCLPPVCRSLLEAYVDLKNSADSDEYRRALQATMLRKKSQFAKNAHKYRESSPFIKAIKDKTDFDELAQQFEQERATVKQDEIPLWEKFKTAGLEHEHRFIYALLCDDVHNGLESIGRNHLVVEGNDTFLQYFRPMPIDELVPLVDLCAVTSFNALKCVRTFVDSENDEGLEPIESALERLRSQYNTPKAGSSLE